MSSGNNPTRRAVLGGLGGVAATLGGFKAFEFYREPAEFVAGFRCPSYEDDIVARVMEGVRAFPLFLYKLKGASVLLKPNLVEAHPERPINTNPAVIAATAEALLRLGAKRVTVGEGPGHMRDTEAILELTGLERAIHQLPVDFIDLNIDEAVYIPLKYDVTKLGKLPVAKSVMTADLVVSMPKMKTHHWAGATLSMKNLFGTVPGSEFGWPKNPLHWAGISRSIIDLWSSIAPDFTIVDGIVGMEGDGPIMGSAIQHGVLLFGECLPAVDATAARLMGLKPELITHLSAAQYLGSTIREGRITLIGDTLPVLPYALVDRFAHLRA
jgi:uncharacterized protein (DUF362 family)